MSYSVPKVFIFGIMLVQDIGVMVLWPQEMNHDVNKKTHIYSMIMEAMLK